jgi:DNA-binding transcriptional MerR regulator
MNSTDTRRYNLDQLSSLAELPKRTIRFYIQNGLILKPTGVGRGAHYTTEHLDQLLEIRKWQRAGLSLERIRELLEGRTNPDLLPPPLPRRKGAVEVWSHLVLDEGVELILEPNRAGLSPEQVRALARAVMVAYASVIDGEADAPTKQTSHPDTGDVS